MNKLYMWNSLYQYFGLNNPYYIIIFIVFLRGIWKFSYINFHQMLKKNLNVTFCMWSNFSMQTIFQCKQFFNGKIFFQWKHFFQWKQFFQWKRFFFMKAIFQCKQFSMQAIFLMKGDFQCKWISNIINFSM
jgi:hypothetical protein